MEKGKDMHWLPVTENGITSMKLVPLSDYEKEQIATNKRNEKYKKK